MQAGRRVSGAVATSTRDKAAAELSPATPATPPTKPASTSSSTAAAVAAVAKFHRIVHGNGTATATATASPSPAATTPEQDAQALIKSFRRKKNLRARLLLPLQSTDSSASPKSSSHRPHPHRRLVSPRKAPVPPSLTVVNQSLLTQLEREASNNRDEDGDEHDDDNDDDNDREIAALARVHALLASPDEIDRWIATYETEKAQFASFALFTEMKLDEIADQYVGLAGRPNAVEAAACCATLLKMPGIVGCYRSLLEKLAYGVLSVVYAPDTTQTLLPDDNAPMATLVRTFFARKPYFQRTQELEQQVRDARSLTDPTVLRALTVDEITHMVLQIPVRVMSEGMVNAYATHLPHLDHLLALIDAKKMQLQLAFYQLHGRRRRVHKRRSANTQGSDDAEDDDEDEERDVDDPLYPLAVPLTSSAQICRAITQHAAAFSSSGKEMILCSILEHIEVDSFKDVFKRFDAHAKTCFLHHLSVLESSDHLQLILEQLPNAGDTLFRFYYVICGGGGSGRLEDAGRPDPKHAFFHKVLSAEMEYFFLCDLAAYLNDEQWTLLSHEYEKHAQARKARRRRLRRRHEDGSGGGDNVDEEDGDGEGDDDERDVPSKSPAVRATSSLEQFQTLIWNYVHQHKCTSPQVWSLVHAVLMPSLEEPETLACIDHCMDRMHLTARWKKLLALVEELETNGGSTSAAGEDTDADQEQIRHARLKLLKRVLGMLSREDRASWVDKTAAKYGTPKPLPPPPRKEPVPVTTIVQAPPKPVNLEDPKPHIALMRLDTKMLWLEALLHAVANDKETSARTAMLKETLLPFLNGHTPAVVPVHVPVAAPPEETIRTVADAEKAILAIVGQLKQKSAADEAALWQKIVPESFRPKVIATTDRSVSPIPELIPKQPPVTSVAAVEPPKPTPHGWWETASPDSEVAKAFRALVGSKPEAEVLEFLHRGEVPKPAPLSTPVVVTEAKTDADTNKQGSAALRSTVKRKVSAIVAVSEPMEWKEYIKVGMLDQGTQTDFPMATIVDMPAEEKPAAVARAPLTLTSLLGRGPNDKAVMSGSTPRRKGDAKFQKLNSTAVPRSISGLITSWRVNADQLAQFAKKSMPTVLRLIADAYGELLTAGRRKANFQATVASGALSSARGAGKELTLAQVVYQQFLHSYGLPGIADMHLLALSCALEAYRLQHLRVEFFSRFVFDEVSKLELSNYLEFLECLVCDDPGAGSTTTNANNNGNSSVTTTQGPTTSKRQRFVPRIVVSDKENWMVPLEKAQEAAQLCFRAMRKQAVTAFCEKLAVVAAQGTGGYVPGGSLSSVVPAAAGVAPAIPLADSGRSSPTALTLTTTASLTGAVAASPPTDGLQLNVDYLLKLVVDEWRDEQLRREVHLLNVFRAGDVNGDGELTSAEFTQIVQAIDHTKDLGDILLMYSETLRRTQSDAIDADSFLQVAKEYELDRAAWNEDGDLRNVVNDMHELEATWGHTKPFFIGTLEALARDLPTVHFLRVCEGAGCGCLKCILDGYIGFQRMRREFFTTSNPRVAMVPSGTPRSTAVSEALLWARFWHLMRQLYEAASESPGILTAWDGADYMRVDAAPRPPPRFLKFRRMALPNFLFPDTTRISGMVSIQHVQPPEAFDRDAIVTQFTGLMTLMTYAAGTKSTASTSAADSSANPQ